MFIDGEPRATHAANCGVKESTRLLRMNKSYEGSLLNHGSRTILLWRHMPHRHGTPWNRIKQQAIILHMPYYSKGSTKT